MSFAVTVRAIENDQDLDEALKRVAQIIGAQKGTPEGAELDVLGTLIVAYEQAHHAIEPLGPVDAIRYALEEAGLNDGDLAQFIGSQAKVSELLAGRRELSLNMIRRLHEGLGIPLESLIKPVVAQP